MQADEYPPGRPRHVFLWAVAILPYLLYGVGLLVQSQTRSGTESALNLLLLASIYLAIAMLVLAVIYHAFAVVNMRQRAPRDWITLAVMMLALCPFLIVLIWS